MKNFNDPAPQWAIAKMEVIKISVLIICTFLSMNCLAQSGGSLRGKVIDSVTKLPLDYATVSIFKTSATSPLNGAVTDAKGVFVIKDLPTGTYRVKAEFLGYSAKQIGQVTVDAAIGGNTLGEILLSPLKRQLADVTITGKTPLVENKIDKLVYNAANDVTSQGGVALDVLRKVPMVNVDVDGNVSLQGNSNVRFLINGKPSSIFGASLADALQTIPASQIQRIEVITSPGAKYDLAGTAGIINIVLKQAQKDGLNGSVSMTAGTRLQNGAFNINTHKGNFGVNAFFSGTDQLNSTAIINSSRRSTNPAGDTITNFKQNGLSPFTRSGYQSGIGTDWNITPKDELSATFSIDNNAHNGSGPTSQNLQMVLPNGNVISDVLSQENATSRQSENATDWSLSYKKTFNKADQELDILYTSTTGRNTNDILEQTNYLNANYPAVGSQSNNPGKDHETDISVDYTQPVSKTFNLQAGAKVTMVNINNNVVTDTLLNAGSYAPDAGQTNSFIFKRNIYAAYLSTEFKLFNDFLEGDAGMRFERTTTMSDFPGVNIPAQNLWGPSLLLQHNFDETRSLKFAYSYRVQRPEYEDLNPFLNIIDTHDITTGNPLAKTEIGHKYELDYSKTFSNDDNISFGLFYDYNSNDMQMITTYYPVYTVNGANYYDLSLAKTTNIGSQTYYGTSISGSITVSDKLNLRSDLIVREMINSEPGQPNISGIYWETDVNATYQIIPGMAAELFGNYTSRRIEFQDSHPALLYYVAAIKKQFDNKKASIGITASNPFNKYVNQLATNYGTNFMQNDLRRVPLRSFGLTLTYKFGKSDKKKKEEDEKPQVPTI